MKLALAISALMAVPSALATISIQFYTTTDCSGSVYTARQVFSDDNGACHNTMLPDYSVVKAYKAINSNSSTGTGAQYLRIWYDSQCQVDYDTAAFGNSAPRCMPYNNKTFEAYQSVHSL